jgi:hypothetical protein
LEARLSTLETSWVIVGDFLLDVDLLVLNVSELTFFTASDRSDVLGSNSVVEHPFLSLLVIVSDSHSIVQLVIRANDPDVSVGTDSDLVGDVSHFSSSSILGLSLPGGSLFNLLRYTQSVVDSSVSADTPNVSISSDIELD